jgi:HEAT repeat protein
MHVATNEADRDDDFAIFALGEIRERPDEVVPLLINVLESTNKSLHMNAAFALGKFGVQAAAATPLLSKILTDQRANTSGSRRIKGALTLSDAVTYALDSITNGAGNVIPAQ